MVEHRIVILDPQPAYRVGLRSILEQEPDMSVVAEFGDDGLEPGNLAGHEPHLVVADYEVSSVPAHHFVSWLRDAVPGSRVFIHSSNFAVGTLFTLLRSGINGFATKNVSADTVRYGVRTVLHGELFLCVRDPGGGGARSVIEHPSATEKPVYSAALQELTPREREVFELVARGYTTHTIGTALGISHRTVENHRSNIMRKLSLHSQIDLVLYAARLGLVEL
jgi:DNA-binding NarL/FixJ family response regulator